MLVEQFTVGGDRNYGYLVADEDSGVAALIDPCYSPEMLLEFAAERNLTISYVFNTHGHPDHTNGNDVARNATGVTILGYGVTDPVSGFAIVDGAELPLGTLTIKVLHTPGHTNDSICLVVEDAVFTGDTLFVGKVGGTDLGKNARKEYESLHQKLMVLPDDTRVFSGHNYGAAPTSTIGHEKQTNPFIIQPDFEAFVYLKENWADYKLKHGIK